MRPLVNILVSMVYILATKAAPQNRVAVRVAAKAVDDGFVAQLKAQVVLVAQLRKQRQRILRKSAWRGAKASANGFVQRGVFDEVLLGG